MLPSRLMFLLTPVYETTRVSLNEAHENNEWLNCVLLSAKLIEIGAVLTRIEFLELHNDEEIVPLEYLISQIDKKNPQLVSFDPVSIFLHYSRVQARDYAKECLEKIYESET